MTRLDRIEALPLVDLSRPLGKRWPATRVVPVPEEDLRLLVAVARAAADDPAHENHSWAAPLQPDICDLCAALAPLLADEDTP
jgi:hypothetical protein